MEEELRLPSAAAQAEPAAQRDASKLPEHSPPASRSVAHGDAASTVTHHVTRTPSQGAAQGAGQANFLQMQ